MLIAVMLSAVLAQDQVENPEYKGWKSFKPGSSVTYKFSREGSSQSGEQKVTLKSIDDNEAVIATEFALAGKSGGKALERKVPAKLAAAQAPERKEGPEEEIEVGGKMLKCRTLSFEKKNENGKTMKMKYWVHEEIPGSMAKVETNFEGTGGIQMVASQWEKK
jgi:hypothetical protein